MRNSVSISLPDAVLRKLKDNSKKENANISEVVRKALKDYFFKTEFDELRKKAMLEAAKKGIVLSEDEILEKIS